MKNYYRILDLGNDAGEMEIKKSYRRLAKRFHPDVNDSVDARHRFIEINEAYEFLSDPDRRASYRYRQNMSEQDRVRREAVYREWVNREQDASRANAAKYATRSMDDFVASRVYKTAMVVNRVYNYIFLCIGFVMIFGPILRYMAMTEEELAMTNLGPASIIIPVLFGAFFTYGVYYFLFRYDPDE